MNCFQLPEDQGRSCGPWGDPPFRRQDFNQRLFPSCYTSIYQCPDERLIPTPVMGPSVLQKNALFERLPLGRSGKYCNERIHGDGPLANLILTEGPKVHCRSRGSSTYLVDKE